MNPAYHLKGKANIKTQLWIIFKPCQLFYLVHTFASKSSKLGKLQLFRKFNFITKSIAVIAIVSVVLLFPFILSIFVSPKNLIDEWRNVLGNPEYTKVDPKRPIKDQTRQIILGDREFEIPIAYIDGGKMDDTSVSRGINLKYVLPDYTSILEFPSKEVHQQAFKDHRIAFMLLRPASEGTTVEQIVESRKKFESMDKYEGVEYGLEKYSDFDPSGTPQLQGPDVYLEMVDGKIISLISCSSEKRGDIIRFPTCQHRFNDDGLAYEIAYNKKKYLQDWRNQRIQAIKFINSMEVSNFSKKE